MESCTPVRAVRKHGFCLAAAPIVLILALALVLLLPCVAQAAPIVTPYAGSGLVWGDYLAPGDVIFNSGNVGGVASNPPNNLIFTTLTTYTITSISNYHWSSSAAPGTITLAVVDGPNVGTWQAYGENSNHYWICRPDVTIPAGTYILTDSAMASWSHNSTGYASDGMGMSLIKATSGAVEEPTRYEQLDSGIEYWGIWQTNVTAKTSGSSFSYNDVLGSFADVHFDGTYLAWIAKTSNAQGIAKVTLDDEAPVYVDLYSPTVLYKQVVWETPDDLAPGAHRVKIECTHTGRPAAIDNNVNVDAFDIIGSLTYGEGMTRYQQTNSVGFTYKGTWGNFRKMDASFGSYIRSSSSGGYVLIKFNGTRLDWIATIGTTLSKADVYVDGVFKTTVDLANPVAEYQQMVFSTGDLTAGHHTVKILRKAGDATGKFISIDAVDVNGVLEK